jgi:hypothetical protein
LGFGCVLGLAPIKFGNPIVLDKLIEVPKDGWELVFQPWPLRWGYLMLAAAVVLGIKTYRLRGIAPTWWMVLPFIWFAWEIAAAPSSISPALTQVTLLHFGACLVCFSLGLLGLSNVKRTEFFWIPLLLAFLWVLWNGFEQHYGGLEATRKLFYQQPDWQKYPPEYLRRIESNRIFSTLVYPNALAGAVLLFLPVTGLLAWRFSAGLTTITRGVLVGLLGYGGIACLYWSGSKSGWLIAMVLVLATLLRRPFSKRLKMVIIAGVLVAGLTGFFVKFAGYFGRGAPSVSARFTYWQAAVHWALADPVFGTGPGSFSVAYSSIKPAGAEMTQLVHNDYLEQASDSGFLGAAAYATFVIGSLFTLARRCRITGRPESFLLWLGLMGWALQSCVEFLLYIPGLSWPAFTLFGWLWGKSTHVETASPADLIAGGARDLNSPGKPT